MIRVSLTLILSFFTSLLSAQSPCDDIEGGPGLIINELGNTVPFSGAEYIELLVLGDPENPQDNVDLFNWTIDDNNNHGELDTGSETGLIRLGQCFNSVPPGTIILIYNDLETIYGINSFNNGMPNSSGFWQIPFSSSCILKDLSSSEEPLWSDYIPMRNYGDVLQIRKPEGELFHALYWGKNLPLDHTGFFAEADHPAAVNLDVKSLSKTSVQLIGPDYLNDNQFLVRGDTGTPGAYNSDENEAFINSILTGSDYFDTDMPVIVHHYIQRAYKSADGLVDLADIWVEVFGPKEQNISEFVLEGFEFPSENVGTDQWLLTGLPPGVYELSMVDFCGREHPLVIVLGNREVVNLCEGNCDLIGEDRGPDFCYSWEPAIWFTEEDRYLPQVNFCPSAGQEVVKQIITDAYGSQHVNEYIFNLKTGDDLISPTPAIVCEDGNITLFVADNYTSYQWSHSDAEISNATLVTSDDLLESNTISVTVEDESGCVLSDEIDIYDGNELEDIFSYFREKGFLIIPGVDNITNGFTSGGGNLTSIVSGGGSCPIDYTNGITFTLDIDEESTFIDLNQILSETCNLEGNEFDFYISDNESFCSALGEVTESLLSETPTNWYHIMEGFNNENYLILGSNLIDFIEDFSFFSNPFSDYVDEAIEELDEGQNGEVWTPLDWVKLEELGNEFADLYNKAKTRFPPSMYDGKTSTAYWKMKMRLGLIMEHAALAALKVKKGGSLRYLDAAPATGGKKRKPDGIASQTEVLRRYDAIPDEDGLVVYWDRDEQVLLHEVKIAKGASILFEPEYRSDPRQLSDFTLSFAQPRPSTEYPGMIEYFLGVSRYSEEFTRSPLETYAAGLHMITLSHNVLDHRLITAAFTNKVQLPHSYFEYRRNTDFWGRPIVEIRLKYRINHTFFTPLVFREFLATGNTGMRNNFYGRLNTTKKAVPIDWTRGATDW